MYLEHFNIKELPFTLTPNTNYFCNLSGHQAAMNVLLLSLRSGEGFIKIVGEVGTGKTLLCRMLLDTIGDEFVTAYVPSPNLTPLELHKVLAQELGIKKPHPKLQHELLEKITDHLIALHAEGKRPVILIDEAQALPLESLEAVRLLTNLETKTSKLLQVVLFGQSELDTRLKHHSLRQLRQRISFSYELPPLNRSELDAYLCHRLAMVGYTLGPLFTQKAADILFRKSGGYPRLINILCHKAMILAYGRGEKKIDHKAMKLAVKDTDYVSAVGTSNRHLFFWGAGLVVGLVLIINLTSLILGKIFP